jgi:hypothetical protein
MYEASELFHLKEREYEARQRLEEAELRRMEADERRRSQGRQSVVRKAFSRLSNLKSFLSMSLRMSCGNPFRPS